MRHVLLAAVVQRVALVVRGDEIPARAAAAQLVERSELTSERIGFVEGRGRGDDEAEMVGHRGQCRHDGHRLELDHLAHAAALVGAARGADGRAVGEEEKVELAALGKLCGLHHLGKARTGMLVRAGVPPRCHVLAGLVHEGAEPHHATIAVLGHASDSSADA